MKKILQEEKSVNVCDRCGREEAPKNWDGDCVRLTLKLVVSGQMPEKYLGEKELCRTCQGSYASFMLNHKTYPN